MADAPVSHVKKGNLSSSNIRDMPFSNEESKQGVCQVREVREVREKSGNSLYPLNSQGKVREVSEKSGKCQGISVESRNLLLGTAN